jgi:hypothetical protein
VNQKIYVYRFILKTDEEFPLNHKVKNDWVSRKLENQAAIKLQAAWKGYLQRKKFRANVQNMERQKKQELKTKIKKAVDAKKLIFGLQSKVAKNSSDMGALRRLYYKRKLKHNNGYLEEIDSPKISGALKKKISNAQIKLTFMGGLKKEREDNK